MNSNDGWRRLTLHGVTMAQYEHGAEMMARIAKYQRLVCYFVVAAITCTMGFTIFQPNPTWMAVGVVIWVPLATVVLVRGVHKALKVQAHADVLRLCLRYLRAVYDHRQTIQ